MSDRRPTLARLLPLLALASVGISASEGAPPYEGAPRDRNRRDLPPPREYRREPKPDECFGCDSLDCRHHGPMNRKKARRADRVKAATMPVVIKKPQLTPKELRTEVLVNGKWRRVR